MGNWKERNEKNQRNVEVKFRWYLSRRRRRRRSEKRMEERWICPSRVRIRIHLMEPPFCGAVSELVEEIVL